MIDRQQAYLDALDLACERALEKAEKLAANSGRRVVGVVQINEGTVSNSYYSPFSNYVSASSSFSSDDMDGGIAAGELEITAMVNVVYRLD